MPQSRFSRSGEARSCLPPTLRDATLRVAPQGEVIWLMRYVPWQRNLTMSIMLSLPEANGKLAPYTLSDAQSFPDKVTRPLNRVALAAAHVVADPTADIDPWLKAAPDWERTIAYRHYLWDLGLGVAEAMDTAQRGMGLDWTMALELIRQSVESARGRKGAVIF